MPYINEERECGGVGWTVRTWVPDPPKQEEPGDRYDYAAEQAERQRAQALQEEQDRAAAARRRAARDLSAARLPVAQAAFDKYDFGSNFDGECEWQYNEGRDEYWCNVWFIAEEPEDDWDEDASGKYMLPFVVQFERGTTRVLDSFLSE